MDFGDAIRAMKQGDRVQRAGWNGKNMHIFIEDKFTALIRMSPDKVIHREYESVICMFTAQGKTQPGWLASQMDMLAEDWQVVPI